MIRSLLLVFFFSTAALAQDVTILTCPGNVGAPGPALGGTLYVGTCGQSYYRVTFLEQHSSGTFPQHCFSGGSIYANYKIGGLLIAVSATNLEGCNTLPLDPKGNVAPYYKLDATFSGLDSRGLAYNGTLQAPLKYYGTPSGMRLTTTGAEVRIVYSALVAE